MHKSFALLSTIGLLSACGASVRTMDVSQVPNFTVASFNAASGETITGVMTTGPKAMVLLLKKGEKVPVTLHASFGPIALQPGQDYLVFSQDHVSILWPRRHTA